MGWQSMHGIGVTRSCIVADAGVRSCCCQTTHCTDGAEHRLLKPLVMQKLLCCACSMHVTPKATVWMMYRQRVGLNPLSAAGPGLTRLPAARTGLALLVAAPTRLLDPSPIPRLRRRRLRRLHRQRRGGYN